jgi:hypothetical protein
MTTVESKTSENIYRVTAVDKDGEIYTHTCIAVDKRESVKKTQAAINTKENWADREFIIIDIKSPFEINAQATPTNFTYKTTDDDYLTHLIGDNNA